MSSRSPLMPIPPGEMWADLVSQTKQAQERYERLDVVLAER